MFLKEKEQSKTFVAKFQDSPKQVKCHVLCDNGDVITSYVTSGGNDVKGKLVQFFSGHINDDLSVDSSPKQAVTVELQSV